MNHITDWLVVAINPPTPQRHSCVKNKVLYWLLGLLKNGYRHVFAVGYCARNQQYIMVDPNSLSVDISIYKGDHLTSHILDLYEVGIADIRVVQTKNSTLSSWQIRPVMSCASILAHILQLPTKFGLPLTPYGLFRQIDRLDQHRPDNFSIFFSSRIIKRRM